MGHDLQLADAVKKKGPSRQVMQHRQAGENTFIHYATTSIAAISRPWCSRQLGRQLSLIR